MNNRELLEFAAKAAGVELLYDTFGQSANADREYNYWNPLIDDKDALSLIMELRLNIEYLDSGPVMVSKLVNKEVLYTVVESTQKEKYANTRLAIVKVAAEIGRDMK